MRKIAKINSFAYKKDFLFYLFIFPRFWMTAAYAEQATITNIKHILKIHNCLTGVNTTKIKQCGITSNTLILNNAFSKEKKQHYQKIFNRQKYPILLMQSTVIILWYCSKVDFFLVSSSFLCKMCKCIQKIKNPRMVKF